MSDAQEYWKLANYIVAFYAAQTLALSYTLAKELPGMKRVRKANRHFFPRMAGFSAVTFVVLLIGCWCAEVALMTAGQSEAAYKVSLIAMVGRVVIVVFATACLRYLLHCIDALPD